MKLKDLKNYLTASTYYLFSMSCVFSYMNTTDTDVIDFYEKCLGFNDICEYLYILQYTSASTAISDPEFYSKFYVACKVAKIFSRSEDQMKSDFFETLSDSPEYLESSKSHFYLLVTSDMVDDFEISPILEQLFISVKQSKFDKISILDILRFWSVQKEFTDFAAYLFKLHFVPKPFEKYKSTLANLYANTLFVISFNNNEIEKEPQEVAAKRYEKGQQGVTDKSFVLEKSDVSERYNSDAYKAIQPYIRDLSKNYEINHPVCYGRDQEIEKIQTILLKKKKNNVLLIGEAGVGKTAIAEYLPCIFQSCKELRSKLLFELDLSALYARTKYRGDLEDRIQKILHNAEKLNCILFIDEIHMLMASDGPDCVSLSQYLKPALARGSITVIGATTVKEYKALEKDKAFDRRFDKITICEPSVSDTTKILSHIVSNYEEYHSVAVPTALLQKISELSARYMYDKNSPDRALDLLDKCCVYVKMHKISELTLDIVKTVCTEITGIEVRSELLPDNLEALLNSRVFGQESAIKSVCRAIYKNKLGVSKENRPVGVFMFQGETGIGKTELAKAIASEVYGSEKNLIRFDMNEYSDKTSINKFIGSSAGYIGYDDEPAINQVRLNPYSVVLFDEIEKADSAIHNLMLNLLDEGYLKDSQGRNINFRNTFIIFTSNALLATKKSLGFAMPANNLVIDNESKLNQLTHTFSKEFLNRLDEVIDFNKLSDAVSVKIIKKELLELQNRYESALPVKFLFNNPDVLFEYILKKAAVKEYGARSINRVIVDDLEDMFISHLMKLNLKQELVEICVTVLNNKIEVEAKELITKGAF